MGRLRWLLILTGALVVVVALVILVDVLARFHGTLTLISPLLANGVLLLIGVLLVAVIATGGYYLLLFTRPRRRRPPAPPRTPQEAARASLSAVEQQLDQIADTVAQQALREQSQALAASLERGVLRLVVFGTGSAGKTSLINALLGEVAGETGAPLGTTLERQRYPLTLAGVPQTLELVDTPGLAEVGPTGTVRGQQARQWATEADLLLFVVDNDLRQSEYGPLRTLLAMGKRSLVVLNKTDLYLEMEVRQICDRITQTLSNQLAPEDVVAVAANPKPVTMTDGDQWQPAPEVWPLVTRLAQVLRQEGADLMADNMLLQAQRLRDQARAVIDQQRQQQADQVIDRFQWIGAGVLAVTPLPGLDLLATAAVNAQMVVALGQVYGCSVSLAEGRELALSLAKTLTSLGVVKGALQLLSIGLQTNLTTVLAGRALQGVSAAYLTRIAGKSFAQYFRQNQDWGDGGMGEVVQKQFELNRREEFVKAFVQDAIASVVRPIFDPDGQPAPQDSDRPADRR